MEFNWIPTPTAPVPTPLGYLNASSREIESFKRVQSWVIGISSWPRPEPPYELNLLELAMILVLINIQNRTILPEVVHAWTPYRSKIRLRDFAIEQLKLADPLEFTHPVYNYMRASCIAYFRKGGFDWTTKKMLIDGHEQVTGFHANGVLYTPASIVGRFLNDVTKPNCYHTIPWEFARLKRIMARLGPERFLKP